MYPMSFQRIGSKREWDGPKSGPAFPHPAPGLSLIYIAHSTSYASEKRRILRKFGLSSLARGKPPFPRYRSYFAGLTSRRARCGRSGGNGTAEAGGEAICAASALAGAALFSAPEPSKL